MAVIRSSKHNGASPITRYADFNEVLFACDFDDFTKSAQGDFKPLIVIMTDGSTEENQR